MCLLWRVRDVVPPAPAHKYGAKRPAAELFHRGVPTRSVNVGRNGQRRAGGALLETRHGHGLVLRAFSGVVCRRCSRG